MLTCGSSTQLRGPTRNRSRLPDGVGSSVTRACIPSSRARNRWWKACSRWEPAGGAAIGAGVPGVVHGMTSYLKQDEYGQVLEAESISAGLDYPGVGPEHAYLADIGRARYPSVTDAEVLDAFALLTRTEGIIPALEPAHALAWVSRERAALSGRTVLINLSGRGDKDVAQVMEIMEGSR